jgi:hypothetical protein
MKAGSPVNYAENRYWPRGERVFMTLAWTDAAADAKTWVHAAHRVRAEEILYDARTHKALASTGLVFCGSYWVPPAPGAREPEYRADFGEPGCIASNYNEPSTVLDLPRQAGQGSVYGSQQPNPAYHLAPRQPLTVILEPEYKDGRKRVCDLALDIALPADAPSSAARALRYTVTDAKGRTLNADGDTFVHALAALGKVAQQGQDPFITVQWGPTLPLRTARQAAAMLGAVEAERGLRVEPPGPGQLYYRALLPDERWRDPAMRMGQPWELHVLVKDGKAAATLVDVHENWDVPNPPQYEMQPMPVADSATLAKTLATRDGDRPRGVVVFIDEGASYGALMGLLGPALATHNKIMVFAETPDAKPH